MANPATPEGKKPVGLTREGDGRVQGSVGNGDDSNSSFVGVGVGTTVSVGTRV